MTNAYLAERISRDAGLYQDDTYGQALQEAISNHADHLTDEQQADVYATVQDSESYQPAVIERALNRA